MFNKTREHQHVRPRCWVMMMTESLAVDIPIHPRSGPQISHVIPHHSQSTLSLRRSSTNSVAHVSRMSLYGIALIFLAETNIIVNFFGHIVHVPIIPVCSLSKRHKRTNSLSVLHSQDMNDIKDRTAQLYYNFIKFV